LHLFLFFYGEPGEDPDAYLERFQVVAIANDLAQNKYVTSFPGNLLGEAQRWYSSLNPKPNTWNDMKDEFLNQFRPQAYHNALQDQLQSFQMYPNEPIAGYYTRLKNLLRRWHNHGLPESWITNIFVRGLLEPMCIYQIKLSDPQTLEAAYTAARTWEEAMQRSNMIGQSKYQILIFYP